MKKNNIIVIALTAVFVFGCILFFALVSKGPKKQILAETYNRIETFSSAASDNYFISSAAQTTTVFTTLPADNHFQTQNNAVSTVPSSAVSAVATMPATQVTQPTATENISDKMCIITSTAADTWDGTNSDNLYRPYLSTLAKGTMDYVVGVSDKYDKEEGTTKYFYNLSCGRKVLQTAASLVPKTDMGINAVSVVSSSANSNGELTFVLSEKWKVPYFFSFAPQEYYSAGDKKYCVENFTATAISFTFYYTNSFSGNVNTSGSAIVSSASWSSNPSQNTVTLTLPLIAQGRFYGYSAAYDANGNFVITINNKPKTLSGSVIMLDPGHGGKDSGSVSPSRIYESNVNLAVATLVKSELERRGATVYMTRTGNNEVDLIPRKEMAYSVKPDIFVSIHCDGSENRSTMGTSAYYFKPMSKALSQLIHDELLLTYKNDIYAGQSDKISKVDRFCRYYPFSVTRLEDCPSVLIEIGFISSSEESAVISNATNQQKIAVAITNGIERYITAY